MMYSNKFVASLKVAGKILRENSGVVTLPFGSEYGILLKNLGSRRAMVRVSVDGQDATDGTRLILKANESIELERFIRNGNLKSGNRFKFIERTKDIEDHRGIKQDDGLIRAEFWAEKEVVETPVYRHRFYDDDYTPWRRPYVPYVPYYPYSPLTYTKSGLSDQSYSVANNAHAASGGNILRARAMQCSMPTQDMAEIERGNDAGITVPGSESRQSFYSSSGFDLESNSTVIVLQLRGEVAGTPVAAPITVNTKLVCPTCGRHNPSIHTFCSKCGTNLQLI